MSVFLHSWSGKIVLVANLWILSKKDLSPSDKSENQAGDAYVKSD